MKEDGEMDFSAGAFFDDRAGVRCLVYKPEDDISGNYRMNIVCSNEIPGVAPVGIKHDNGETYLYYSLASRIPLSSFTRENSLSMDGLLSILSRICRTICLGRHYLLNEEEYIIEEEYIFVQPSTLDTVLIYFPGGRSRVKPVDAFKKLLIGLASQIEDEYLLLKSGLLQKLLQYMRSGIFNIRDFNARLNELISGGVGPDEEDRAGDMRNERALPEGIGAKGFIRKAIRNLAGGFPDFFKKVEGDRLKQTASLNHTILKKIRGEGCDDIKIDKPVFVIGRDVESADGIIRNNAVGGMHARIESESGGGYSIFDLNSINGTFVNDMRLKPGTGRKVQTGDMISIANCDFEFNEMS